MQTIILRQLARQQYNTANPTRQSSIRKQKAHNPIRNQLIPKCRTHKIRQRRILEPQTISLRPLNPSQLQKQFQLPAPSPRKKPIKHPHPISPLPNPPYCKKGDPRGQLIAIRRKLSTYLGRPFDRCYNG